MTWEGKINHGKLPGHEIAVAVEWKWHMIVGYPSSVLGVGNFVDGYDRGMKAWCESVLKFDGNGWLLGDPKKAPGKDKDKTR